METGLILTYWDVDLDEIIALVDISVWPYFVIPRIYGARQGKKQYLPFKPERKTLTVANQKCLWGWDAFV